ncbi:hypothetical protein Tco_1033155 [Tanacetum coccineum]|uniref:Uncharacterized protein n=1 Tax=Tanacetum coccineum TaxID=301880 RepID=A0ABQ5GE41_9ASTR
MTRVASLEKDLKQTKLTMGSAIVKLVKKMKKLEGILKRKNVVFSNSEKEEPEDQGRKSQDDPLVSLVQGLVTPSKTTVNTSGEEQVEDISPNTLEAAKTLSRVASQKLKSIDKGKRYKRRKETKGKKVVTSLDFQEEVNIAAEGVNTGSAKKKKNYTDEDWDLIRANIEANAELSKSVLGIDLQGKDFAKKMVDLIIKQGERGVYQIVREDRTDIVYINFGAMLKDITRDDLTELYRIVMNRYDMNGLEDELEKVLWGYLKNMFEEPLRTDPIWSVLGQQRIMSWRDYVTAGTCLNLESMDIYMLIERQYPLSAEVCKAMLDKKLQGGKSDEDCYKLLKWMEKQAGIRK